MAVKHVVTTGVGFSPAAFIITEGFGDLSGGGGGGPSPTPWLQNRTRRLLAAIMRHRRRR